ncbi:hypothetical protein Ancab_004681 [Ancistrocladus abbreviatus]
MEARAGMEAQQSEKHGSSVAEDAADWAWASEGKNEAHESLRPVACSDGSINTIKEDTAWRTDKKDGGCIEMNGRMQFMIIDGSVKKRGGVYEELEGDVNLGLSKKADMIVGWLVEGEDRMGPNKKNQAVWAVQRKVGREKDGNCGEGVLILGSHDRRKARKLKKKKGSRLHTPLRKSVKKKQEKKEKSSGGSN